MGRMVQVGRFFCQGYTDDILYGAGKEDEVCGGGDLMVERERRPFIGALSCFVVGDDGFSRGRGGVGSFFAQTVERGESR